MAQEPITVICGANKRDYSDTEGKTVGQVREDLAEDLNIPADARALINGEDVDDDCPLDDVRTLEFIRPTGSKG